MEVWRTELYHYGTPRHSGRYKWGSGNRPYQGDDLKKNFGKTFDKTNDGTYRKRKEKINRAFSRTEKQGKDKPNISPAEGVVKNTKNIIDNSSDIVRRTQDIRNRKKDSQLRSKFQSEASTMSNDELRRVIDRMNLEDAYVNKKTSRYSRGRSTALDILGYAGDVTSIALAAVGIAATIHGMRKKQ